MIIMSVTSCLAADKLVWILVGSLAFVVFFFGTASFFGWRYATTGVLCGCCRMHFTGSAAANEQTQFRYACEQQGETETTLVTA